MQRSISKREKIRKEMKGKPLYIDAHNQSRCPNCRNRVCSAYNKEHLNTLSTV
jgi:hypothetical protein